MLSTTERDELVEKHLDFARALASKLRAQIGGTDLELDELASYGYRGLVEAAQRYDPTRGAAFTTFAYYRVRGAIFDGLRKQGWLSRSEYARYLDGANELLHNDFERTQGGAAARAGGDTRSKLAGLASALDNVATVFVTSVDAAVLQDIADPAAQTPSETAQAKQRQSAVREALVKLPEKEQKLIEMVYYQGLSLTDAGRKLGLSKSWSSRLHARAIKLLGKRLGRAFSEL